MLFVQLSVIISVIPACWLLFSGMDVRNGKKERLNWKGPLTLFVALAVIILIQGIYLNLKYDIPIFTQANAAMAPLMAVLLISGGMSIVIIIVIIAGPVPFHEQKATWRFMGVFTLYLLVLFYWFAPAGEKLKYVRDLNIAYEGLEEVDEEISVVLASSEDPCLRKITCDRYENVFYVRNNLDVPKEVQVRIRTLNDDKEELKIMASKVMTLNPGSIKLVVTEETPKFDNPWNKYSFNTEEVPRYYQVQYRYRDVE